MYVKLPIVLLALIEASLLVFATYLAASLFVDGGADGAATASGHLLPAAVLFASFGVVSLFAVGLYSTRQRATTAGVMVRILAAVLNAVGLSALVYFFLPDIAVGRGVLGLMAILGGLTWPRLASCSSAWWTRTSSSVGCWSTAPASAPPACSSCAVARTCVDSRSSRSSPPRATTSRPTKTDSRGVRTTCTAGRSTTRWTRSSSRWTTAGETFPMHEFLECRLAGIDVLELPTFLERETGKVRLDVLSPSWLIFGSGFSASPLQRAMERGFDILASFALLVVVAPVHGARGLRDSH